MVGGVTYTKGNINVVDNALTSIEFVIDVGYFFTVINNVAPFSVYTDFTYRQMDKPPTITPVNMTVTFNAPPMSEVSNGEGWGTFTISRYLMSGWAPELNAPVYWKTASLSNVDPVVTMPPSIVSNLVNKAILTIY